MTATQHGAVQHWAADLRFSVEVPATGTVHGTLTGSGRRLELRLDDPVAFAGRADASAVRGVAAFLARQGLVVAVVQDGRTLLELGATGTRWWQRLVTGSPHLRVAGPRGLLAGLRGRGPRGSAPALPGRSLIPPGTLAPLVPTFGGPRRSVGTTHDPRQGGNPRLVLAVNNRQVPEGGIIHPLRGDVVTVGSAPESQIRLPGIAAAQAEIRRRDDDEMVLVDLAGNGTTRVHGAPVRAVVLRTGTRIDFGDWCFAYRRAEYADHGRPYGGRIGGELGFQRRQPDPRTTRRTPAT